MKAAQIVYEEGIAEPILMGRVDRIKINEEIDFEHKLKIIDLSLDKSKNKIKRFGKIFYKQRKDKGLTLSQAVKLLRTRDYFASMMVKLGEADALVSGYSGVIQSN